MNEGFDTLEHIKKPHAIITGATGFIGSALCKELLDSGWNVSAIIRPTTKNISRLPDGVQTIILDLEEIELLNGNYDVFYHLAWNGSSGEAREDYNEQQKNISLSVMALKAAQKCGCKKFICSGSQAEYGVVKGICTEETLPNPFMMYGAAKLATYNICKVLAKQLNIEFIWTRIYSVYGEGENPDTLMSYLITTLLKGETPQLTSCENMWDFLYISDCVNALRLLADTVLINNEPCIYNVSYGEPKLLKFFIKQTRDIVNPFVGLDFGVKSVEPSSTFWLQPDITHLKKSTAFVPKVNFDSGVIKMLNWIRKSNK